MYYSFRIIDFILPVFYLIFSGSCGSHAGKDPENLQRLDELLGHYNEEKQTLSIKISENDHNWPVLGCDSMIWAGKAGYVLDDVDILAAEYPENKGKFGRRPPIDGKWCWMEDEGDIGAATEWSRDMAIAGLFPWAWRWNKLKVLQRHADYGKDHLWKMGSPIDDGRVLYSPGLIGLLYQMIYALGGEDKLARHSPDIYPSGQEDYHGHLQVMKIWLRGEVEATIAEMEFALVITDSMFKRLSEHVEREPQNPLYAFVLGLYTGNQQATIDLVLDPKKPVGSYVRCETDPEACILAERVFVMQLLLEKLQMI